MKSLGVCISQDICNKARPLIKLGFFVAEICCRSQARFGLFRQGQFVVK